MPLPKITAPTYELVLPSSGRKCRYRPFLVKEEKLLIIAMESEDTKQITTAVQQVLKNCILTRGIKVEKLATFDIEYLFLNIQGKSVGEEVEVMITCPDDGETEVPVVIAMEAGLSFLGFGVRPPTPSWGNILNDGFKYIRNSPWPLIFGGAPIILTTLGFTFLGEALRDVLDPRLRKES